MHNHDDTKKMYSASSQNTKSSYKGKSILL